ncbi:MAG: transcriptional regulator SlyA [Pseudomonadota bacterium]|jgi:DNA-binding MarR family transcriptional regulator
MPKPASHPQSSPGTAGTVFEASIAFLLVTLGNKLSVEAERNLRRRLDLSFMEWRVLAVLGEEPAAPPGRIVAVAGVNKAAVSRAVNSLERRGLLMRRPAPEHRLRTQLFLTEAGQSVYSQGTQARSLGEDAVLDGLSAVERQRLLTSLRHVMRNMDEKPD